MRYKILLRYLWAASATAVGLALAGIACALGATARVTGGVIEVAGGRFGKFFSSAPPALSFLAITFGHVVLGTNHTVLADQRIHEHKHVRQYESWGVLFFPLYVGSCGMQLIRGRNPYWHNTFERQARAACDDIHLAL
jgi:hypothetical protein